MDKICSFRVAKIKYTIDNPKLVNDVLDFIGMETFTGVVKDKDGNIVYYLNGTWHREDGPAAEWSKAKEWWLNGEYYGDNNDFTNESWIRFVELQVLK